MMCQNQETHGYSRMHINSEHGKNNNTNGFRTREENKSPTRRVQMGFQASKRRENGLSMSLYTWVYRTIHLHSCLGICRQLRHLRIDAPGPASTPRRMRFLEGVDSEVCPIEGHRVGFGNF